MLTTSEREELTNALAIAGAPLMALGKGSLTSYGAVAPTGELILTFVWRTTKTAGVEQKLPLSSVNSLALETCCAAKWNSLKMARHLQGPVNGEFASIPSL